MQTLSIVLRIIGVLMMAWGVAVGLWSAFILTNISGLLFYLITSVMLYVGSIAGVAWIVRKRDLDTAFLPTTLLNIAFAFGLTFSREATTNFFSANDLAAALSITLGFGGAATLALGLTLTTSAPHKTRRKH